MRSHSAPKKGTNSNVAGAVALMSGSLVRVVKSISKTDASDLRDSALAGCPFSMR
mgnify:CR=1 FL=1